MELIGRQDISWRTASISLVTGALLGLLAVLHITRTPHPILDFLTLKIKTYAVSILGGSVFRIAISVSPFLLPLMFKIGFAEACSNGAELYGSFSRINDTNSQAFH